MTVHATPGKGSKHIFIETFFFFILADGKIEVLGEFNDVQRFCSWG